MLTNILGTRLEAVLHVTLGFADPVPHVRDGQILLGGNLRNGRLALGNVHQDGGFALGRLAFDDRFFAHCYIPLPALYLVQLWRGSSRAGPQGFARQRRPAAAQRKGPPVADILHQWLITQRQNVPDGSGTAKASDYSLKSRAALTRYLDDGAVPIGNNRVENQIQSWVLGRSSLLFTRLPRSCEHLVLFTFELY